ncbi:hypothetical protein ACFLS8_00350 [Chloroflexota bacterium]
MKFGKTAWITLTAGVLIIAVAAVYMLYLQEKREQTQISDTLTSTQNTATVLAAERASLESALADLQDRHDQAIAQLVAAKAKFPDGTESIEVDELLFRLADDWGLAVRMLTATEPRIESVKIEDIGEEIELDDIIYLTTDFTAEVKGEVADILNLINAIVSHDDFITAGITMVDLQIPIQLTDEEKEGLTDEEIAEEEMASVIIDITIYAYEGE